MLVGRSRANIFLLGERAFWMVSKWMRLGSSWIFSVRPSILASEVVLLV